MTDPWPRVSVIVPVYNAEAALERLLASLRNQSYSRDLFEMILVDNDSSDGSWRTIQAHPEVQGLRETARHTPGAPRNCGLREATGEIIALVDADCWTHPDWLRNGVRYLCDNGLDRVAGHVQFVFRERPNFYEVFDSTVNFQQKNFVSQRWSGTGNLFFRRKMADEIGLLDPTLKSCEDMEFGRRASDAGKTLGYCADAIVYHRTRTNFVSLFKKFVRTGYGCGQLYRKRGYLATSMFFRKANYRPVHGTWRDFPVATRRSARARFETDLMWNAMRMANNIGTFAGYFDLLGLEKERP
jgi:glycosyltransferase involved in cell wall biosynthesis